METSWNVYDYPEPEVKDKITKKIKVIGTFETYLEVEVDPEDDGETQFESIENEIENFTNYELIENAMITIEEFEEV